jgi:hypothetical protein
MYALSPFVEEALSGGCEDYVAVGHAGHGINSYAIHYFLLYRQVALFSQTPWGGAYMGARESEEVRQRFADYEGLIAAIEELPEGAIGPGRCLLAFDVPWSGQQWCRWMAQPSAERHVRALYQAAPSDRTAHPAEQAIRELTRFTR